LLDKIKFFFRKQSPNFKFHVKAVCAAILLIGSIILISNTMKNYSNRNNNRVSPFLSSYYSKTKIFDEVKLDDIKIKNKNDDVNKINNNLMLKNAEKGDAEDNEVGLPHFGFLKNDELMKGYEDNMILNYFLLIVNCILQITYYYDARITVKNLKTNIDREYFVENNELDV